MPGAPGILPEWLAEILIAWLYELCSWDRLDIAAGRRQCLCGFRVDPTAWFIQHHGRARRLATSGIYAMCGTRSTLPRQALPKWAWHHAIVGLALWLGRFLILRHINRPRVSAETATNWS
jgi:hypothetical protein